MVKLLLDSELLDFTRSHCDEARDRHEYLAALDTKLMDPGSPRRLGHVVMLSCWCEARDSGFYFETRSLDGWEELLHRRLAR